MNARPTGITRICDAVAAELETRILEGSLKPGDRLPAERELSAELDVSRPSLREAIQKLVSKGLLLTRHGGGTYVTDRMVAPFVDPWQEMLDRHEGLQDDVLEFRQVLEGQAARLAAERATDADIERLDAVYAAMESAFSGGDPGTCAEADIAFHQAIADAAHNVLIGQICNSLLRVIRARVSRNIERLRQRPEQWRLMRQQHRAMWTAVRERDAEAAAAAARGHVEFVRNSMVEHAREQVRRHSALRRLG